MNFLLKLVKINKIQIKAILIVKDKLIKNYFFFIIILVKVFHYSRLKMVLIHFNNNLSQFKM